MTIDVYHASGGVLVRKGRPSVSSFVLGETKPTRANTGLPDGWTPAQTISTALTVTTPGTTYTDTRFDDYVTVNAADVTFTRCQFRGPASNPSTPTTYLVRCNTAGILRARFEFCDVIPRTPTAAVHGIEGHDYTLHRCYFAHCVDSINVYNTGAPGTATNVVIEGCCGELHAYFSPCAYQSDNMTHNDAVQHQGGSGTQVVGNTLYGYLDPAVGDANTPAVLDGSGNVLSGYRWARDPAPNGLWTNAGIQVNNNVGTSKDITIDRNWLDGGGATINAIQSTMTGLVITNNRFGQHARQGTDSNIQLTGQAATITGNTDEATGAPANQRRDV